MMKMTVQTLSQSLRWSFHLFLLWIISEEFRRWFGMGGRLVYLCGHGNGGYVHCQVFAIESAAEGAGTGVGWGGTHNAQVSQGPLDVRGWREETSRCRSLWFRTQCGNLHIGIFNEIWCFNEPPYIIMLLRWDLPALALIWWARYEFLLKSESHFFTSYALRTPLSFFTINYIRI